MRVQLIGWDWQMRRLQRHHWSPGAIAIAVVMGLVTLLCALMLIALALAGAVLVGGAYLGYRVLRATFSGGGHAIEQGTTRRMAREARGLLEMARTPDPLDRYLIAVREFDRISAAALAVDPVDLPRRGAARRAAELAEQALNLHDAVAEIEREIMTDPDADGARANVWELSVAARDLFSYCSDLRDARGTPSLLAVRSFITRRTALITRRDALVARLNSAELRRPAEPATRIPVRTEDGAEGTRRPTGPP